MRIVGRYFAVGAGLGSATSLVTLVLIWAWMTLHLGLLGFLIGWIPAGLAAVAVWLTMVVFWGPLMVVAVMVAAALLIWARRGPEREWREPPSPPEAAPSESPVEAPPPGDHGQEEEGPPAALAPPQPEPPAAPPPAATLPDTNKPPASASPPIPAPPPAPRAPMAHGPSDELDSDAAAAGDTSRRPPR